MNFVEEKEGNPTFADATLQLLSPMTFKTRLADLSETSLLPPSSSLRRPPLTSAAYMRATEREVNQPLEEGRQTSLHLLLFPAATKIRHSTAARMRFKKRRGAGAEGLGGRA